jgi:hypothetical protein
MVRMVKMVKPYRMRIVNSGTKKRNANVSIKTCINPKNVESHSAFLELKTASLHPG